MRRSREILALNAAVMALAIAAWGALPAVSWADRGSDRDNGEHGGGDSDRGGGDRDHGDGDHGGGDTDHGGDRDHGGGDADHGGDSDHGGSDGGDRDTDRSGSDRDAGPSDRDGGGSDADREADLSGSDGDRSGSPSLSADASASGSGSDDSSGSSSSGSGSGTSGSGGSSGSGDSGSGGSSGTSGSDSGSGDSGSGGSGSGDSGSGSSGSGGLTDAQKAAEDAAKEAQKAAEDAAKESDKAAEDAAKAAEDARKEADKAAEDAAKEADKQAEDAAKGVGSGSGTSGSATGDAAGAGAARPVDLAYDQFGGEYRAGELVLLGDARTLAAVRGLGLEVVGQETLATLDTTVVRVVVPADRKAGAVLAEIRAAAPGATVDLNSVYRLAAGRTGAVRAAAPRSRPALRGTVGVIDTAVDRSNPTLAAAIVGVRSFARGPAEPPVHGTIVSFQAVSLGARVAAADVFSLDRNGAPAASADGMARAVDWLVGQGVAVINLSLAGPANRALADVVARAQARGVIVVAAAGNAGPAAPPAYPGAYPQVVAVTAVDGSHQIYRYANRGGYIMFAARGVDIAGPAGGATVSGTSYAAPVVAALLAAQLPRQDAMAASRAVDRLRRQARDLGVPGRDPVYGFGVVDQKALRP